MIRSPLALAPLLLLAACGGPRGKDAPGAVSVLAFAPQGVVETTAVEVRFDRPVVTAAELGKESPTSALVVIEPPVPGTWRWAAVDTLVLAPSEPFRPSTRYRARLEAGGLPAGVSLAAPATFEWSTLLFDLARLQPFFRSSADGAVQALVNVELTHEVDPAKAREAIAFLDAEGKPLAATLETSAPAAVMAFRLDGLDASTAEGLGIQVKLARGLGPVAGGEPLAADVVRPLTLRRPEALAVEQIFPAQEGSSYAVLVRFNDEVDLAAATAAIEVTPAAGVSVTSAYQGVRITGAFRAGRTVTVKVRAGLVGLQGGRLAEEVVRQVVLEDLEPALRFQSEGSHLLRSGQEKVGVESVNLKRLSIRVEKVFENNLVHVLPRLAVDSTVCGDEGCEGEYGDEYYGGFYGDMSSMGVTVFEGQVDLEDRRNEWQTSAIPYDAIAKERRTGLYRLRVADAERRWNYVEKWLIATDLALTAKVGREEARVQVVSLSTLAPVAGVEVTFVSRTNQVIGKATTDASGVAVRSLAGQPAGEPLQLVTARRGDDFSYLPLARTRIPTADFDVGGGGEGDAPYEAYVYADRGVYRPGDEARVVVLVRDRQLRTPPAFPYVVEVRDPRWRVFTQQRGSTEEDGARAFAFSFPADVATGDYAVRVLSASGEDVLGRATLKVEEFMPDRIRVDVRGPASDGELSDPQPFEVESRYLFGPPAKGLRAEPSCVFAETEVKTELSSFTFAAAGPDGGAGLAHEETLGELTLDDAGRARFSCTWGGGQPRGPVALTAVASVSERGGRAVTAVASQVLHAFPHYLGVRRASSSAYAEAGRDAGLEWVAVDRQGRVAPGVAVTASFYSVEYRSILKVDGGRYRYVSERTERPLPELTATSGARPGALAFVPPQPGAYRVALRAASGAATSLEFWASGPGWAPWEMNQPDRVELTLDRERHAPGEQAKVMVRAPFDGKLFLTIERDRVLHSAVVDLRGNSGTVTFPVTAAMGPNAYVVAQLVRSPTSVEKLAPLRAFGVAPLTVDARAHRLEVKVTAPPTMRPGAPLEVGLAVAGGQGAVRATVAVVDEGILRVTGFASPDPFAFFTRKRRLGVGTHDVFDLVLPELALPATALVKATGGDALRTKHLGALGARRVRPVALFSGLVKLDAAGRGTVRLDVPEFQGALRVMAVAFERERFGAGQAEVVVRDPVVLTPTLPRFLAPGDRVKVPVEVFNGTGRPGAFTVRMEATGAVKAVGGAEARLDLADQAQGVVELELAAGEVVGAAKVVLRAEGNGERTASTTELPVRAPSTVSAEAAALSARAGQPARLELPRGWLPGTARTHVTVSAARIGQFGGALQYLLQYPHGCVEQTTSRAFPLLYLKGLAEVSAPELAGDTSARYYVDAAISRLGTMLAPGGGFSYWPGGGWGYSWATVYGTHFLVEARKAGHAVDEAVLGGLLEHLTALTQRGALPLYRDEVADFRSQAYALYVLALAGRSNRSALYHAVDQARRARPGEPAALDDELSALLGGALVLSGDRARAGEVLPRSLAGARGPRRGMWSAARADALTLAVLADVAPEHPGVPALANALTGAAEVGRWHNTQENAFALMALGKLASRLGKSDFTGEVKVGGKVVKTFSSQAPLSFSEVGDAWPGQPLEVSVQGSGVAYVGVTVEGLRPGLAPPRAAGIELERTFLSRGGEPVDPARLRQGEVVIVRLSLRAPLGARIDDVAVVDLLPAGLEPENPRLGGESVEPWMKDRLVPDHVDVRDDRLIFFGQVQPGPAQSIYYGARAVTVGDFVLPHAHAEAMYDPATQAQAGGGRAAVLPRE